MWGGVWDRAGRLNMEKFTFNSAVWGYHVYKDVWKPTIGEKLQADQELVNEADKFAVKVVKNNEIVGNLPSQVLANFVVFYHTWWKDIRGSDWL